MTKNSLTDKNKFVKSFSYLIDNISILMDAKTSRQLKENMSSATSKAELSSVFLKFKEVEMSAAIYLGVQIQ